MVTLCEIGIQIFFYQKDKIVSVTNMAENWKELEKGAEETLSFFEYENLEIEFNSCSPSDRLYLDGLDLLQEGICELDEMGNFYLLPENGKRYLLYENGCGYYAFRVGIFEFQVEREGKYYIQRFRILSKQLKNEEWEIMRSDLEEEMRGLSADWIRRNNSVGKQEGLSISSERLYQFFTIKKYVSSMMEAFLDLKDRPNYRLQKAYRREPEEKVNRSDQMTVKHHLKNGKNRREYLVPERIYEYDLPENRLLLYIIFFYEKTLKKFQRAILQNKAVLKREIEECERYKNVSERRAKQNALEQLEEYLETSDVIWNLSGMIKNQEWYSKISHFERGQSMLPPHVMMYDVRYAVFYKLYRELQAHEHPIGWEKEYGYAWKLSSRMYEIWCFIKICRILCSERLGFQARGWIFDHMEQNGLIPDLKGGTEVSFEGEGDKKIRVVYDELLASSYKKCEKTGIPVFSKNSHRRPDIRMDLYKKNIYWCSLILEVKYRSIQSFWQSGNFNCKQQIRAYKNDISSPHYRNLDLDQSIRKIRPVDRVWVLHPSTEYGVLDKTDEGIKLVAMRPGQDAEAVELELKAEIERAFSE